MNNSLNHTVSKTEFLSKELRDNDPIGTKILIEVEIADDNGINLLYKSMFNEASKKALKEITGCEISKIYRKDIKIPEVHTLEDILNLLNTHYKKLREEGKIENV